jgi:hypothetical protein
MPARTAAGYMGEVSAAAFLRRVGKVYPSPCVVRGRGRVWLKKDLDALADRLYGPGATIRNAADVL